MKFVRVTHGITSNNNRLDALRMEKSALEISQSQVCSFFDAIDCVVLGNLCLKYFDVSWYS